MKFIESTELREWVKDSLKKTIFQKAHALSVQTGCEILVKLHDTTDIAGCQYYATNNLRRIYKTSKLRQPGESLVSGETGMPLTDKCIQYEDEPTEDMDGAVPLDDGGGPIDEDAEEEPEPLPMQITASHLSSHTQATQSDIQITHMTNQRNMIGTQMNIKQEAIQQQYNQGAMMQGMGAQQQQGGAQIGAYSVPISPKPYQCSICRKAFKSVHVLQKHTMTFHMPGAGGGATTSRGRGRGARGNKTRGRGRGTTVSRPVVVQQSFQSPPMPIIKPEVDQNRFTCIMCNQTFEQSDQLNEHMSQCPMAPGSSQGAQSDPSTQFVAGSEDQPGFPAAGEFAQEVPPTTSAANWSFPPPDGAPPSGVPVTGASAYFPQQSPAFGTPSQSPGQSPRSSGAGSSRDRKSILLGRTEYRPKLGSSTPMTKRNVIAAILKCKGPVATHRVMNSGYNFLRMLSSKQFISIAKEMEASGLGMIVSLQTGSRPSNVFIKKPPTEIRPILEANLDLCAPDHYTMRYKLPMSKIIHRSTRIHLMAMGLVPDQ